MIDTQFHTLEVVYTPLMNFVNMPAGADTYYTGNEMLAGHTNHNSIGNRQRFIEATYMDSRRKKLVSNERHAGKVQLNEFDQLVTRWGTGTSLMMQLMRGQLGQNIVETQEKLAREALFNNAQFKFLANGTKWASSTADFSTLSGSTYQVDVGMIDQVRLRLKERSSLYLRNWGTYAQPVPGGPFAQDMLVITTPNVIYDVWNAVDNEWLESLALLQDERLINGGQFRYRGMVFSEANALGVLRNAGPITHQCGVTSPISWGDGAPDPDAGSQVDSIYFVGQSSSDVTHYIQCDDVGTSKFTQGDRISIHTARTSDWGVTNGCDFLDGETVEAIVYSVNESTNWIVLTAPMTYEFKESFTATPQSTTAGTFYAFVTNARDVHPIVFVGSRGMCTFAMRTPIRKYEPQDVIADLPGVIRASWDQYGQYNLWNPYIYEVLFAVASDTRSGYDAVDLR